MSNQIVNISYLKTFVSGVLTVNQGSYADSYCPTYEQLTDGTFVVNYVADNNPTSTTNGIKVNGTYADNQLVKREDLTMLYQILQSVTVSTNSTTISCCGGSATLSTTAYFKLRTVKESETTDASKNTSASVTATYSDSKSYTSISGSKITFTKNSINYPTSTSAGARTTTVTGKYSYSSTTKEDTVDIKQNANSVDSSWTNTTQTTTSIGVTDSLSFGAGGGTKNYTVTRYYTQYQEKYDSCGALMDSNSYNTSTTVTPTSYTTSNSAFTCTSNSVTVGAQDSGAEERSGTLTVRWGSFQDTCSLSQSSNAIDESWTATGDPYTYSYSVTVSPWNDLSCGGGTTYATAKLSWKQDYVKYDSLGTIVSSKTENESSDVTNSTTWSTTRGSISSSGVLTYPASTSTGETRTTVTGKYGTYQDTDYMTQTACGATGYTYQILSVTFASSSIGKCDTTAPAVNVNARSGKTNSDGSTTWYDAKNLSTSDYTISYNPSLSQNTSNSERTITATVKYKTAQKTATFTQDAGPCDTESTRTEYDLRVLNLSIDKCSTTASPTVQGCSRTVTSHTDGSADEYGNWSSWTNLSSSDYSLSFNPSIETNETTSEKTYTVTATGKGNYSGKSDTATITQDAGPCYVPTCEVSYDYSEATLSFNAANMGKCDTTSEISNAKITNVKKTNSDCSVSTIDETPQYTVSYNPSGTNETNASRTVKVTLTTTSAYGSMSETVEVTQLAGPCEVQTGTTTDYKIQVLDATIGSCEKSASPTVQGSSRTGTTYSDGTPTSWGAWSDWSNLSSSDYSISFNPIIGANQTSESKTYTATVTGKGNYAGKSDTATITQDAGPCDITSITTEYDIQVIASTIEACDTSASPTVQGRSRNNTAHTSSSTVDEGSWSSWSNLSSSNYSLSYSPSIEKNETSEAKTYTVTVTGKGNYADLTHEDSFSQKAGPCTPLFTPYYLFGIGTTSDEALSGNDSITQTYAAISETFNIKIASRYYTSETSYTNPSFDGSSNQSWVTMDGNSFVVANNNTTSERTATVTYTQSGSGYKVYVYITQSAGECTLYAITNHLTIPTSYTTNFVGTSVYSNISGSKVSITHSKDGLHSSDFSYEVIDDGDGSYSVSVSGLTEQTTTSSTISEITLGRVIITQNSGGCSKTIYIGVTQEAVYQEPANPYIVIESFGTDLQPCQTEITDEINGPTVMYYTGETDDEGVELVLGTDYFFDNFDTYTDCSDVNDTRTIEIRAFGNGKYVGLTSEPFSIDQACCAEEEAVSYTVSFDDSTFNGGVEELYLTSGEAEVISGGENNSACTWRCYSDCQIKLKFYNNGSNAATFRLSGYNFSVSGDSGEILDGKILSPGQSVSYTIKTYLATNADTVIELIEE